MSRLSLVIAVALLALAGAQIATAQSSPQGDTWESIAKLPDFGSVWEATFGGGPRGPGEPPALTPAYAAKLKEYQAAQQSGEIEDGPAANCVPNGMPSIMTQPYPMEILFTPGKITILIEAYAQWRQIFTDGRAHPEDPDLTFNGHSTGHWEGDTLVIETTNFNGKVGITRNGNTLLTSPDLKVVERLTRVDANTLQYEATVDDPQTWTRSWKIALPFTRHPEYQFFEYACHEGNYAMRNILSASRAEEKKAPSGGASSSQP